MSFLVESSIWIDASRETLFRAITDPENFSRFMPGVSEAAFVDDKRELGARIQFKLNLFGLTTRIVAEWTQYEPPISVGFSNISGPIETTALTTLVEESGGTRLERVSTIRPAGAFGKLALPLAARAARRNQELEFEAMRDFLEGREI